MPKVSAPPGTLAPVTAAAGLVASTVGQAQGQAAGSLDAFGLVSSTPVGPNPNAVIPNSDFVILDKPKRKVVCLVFGDGGTGKTSFSIRFTPQPAVLIGFDGRSEYVEEQQKQAGFPVPTVQIAPPAVLQRSDNVQKSAAEVLLKFWRNYDAAIAASKTGRVRTIAIDTASELGEIITLAVRGTLNNVKGDFGRSKDQINQIWGKIFAAARYNGNAHLVLLGRASSIWENNEPTGDFKARVADTVRDAVDFSLHIRLGTGAGVMGLGGLGALGGGTSGLVSAGGGLVPLVPLVPSSAPKEFELVVKKSGNQDPTKFLGEVYRQSDWGEDGPFVFACTRLMPGSVPGDWK
jgi:AAA domain